MATYMRVSPSKMRDRIDASYYHPKFVFNELRLRNSGLPVCELNEIVKDGRRAIYFQTSTLEKNEAPANWVPFLTSDDLGTDGIFVDLDARRRVSPTFADRYPNGLLRSNELLIKVKGPNQTTAYVLDCPEKRILVSGTIWGGIVAKLVDPWYLVAALSSDYGAVARTRLRTNLNVEFLSPDDLLRMEIPIPDLSAQTYIGDKVRQAERLRARARELEEEVKHWIVTESPDKIVPTARERPRRIAKGLISPHSLGPEYNRAMEGHTLFPNYNPLRKFITDCKCGDPIRGDHRIAGPYPYYGASGPIDTLDKYNFDGDYLIVAQDGTIGVASMARGRFWANNHVWVLSVRPEFDGNMIAAFLQDFYPYWKGMTTGSVVPKVTSENLLQIPIPEPIAKDEKRFGDKLRKSNDCVDFSKNLTTTAKLLVEALIEGQISEADLISAQKALEAGDRTSDREILGRLTRKGMDATGELPLFPNLDGIYNALDALDTPEDAP